MNPFALAGALTGFSSLGSGFFVFSRDPSRTLNRVWLAFSGSVAVWGLGSVWIAMEPNELRALWAWRLSFAFGVLWISVLFLHVVCSFCKVHYPGLLPVVYGIGLLQFPFLFTDFFFSGVRDAFSSFYYAVPGPLLSVSTIIWLSLIAVGHGILWKAYREALPFRRKQFAAFSFATVLGFTGASLSYLPLYDVDVYPWGQFAIPVAQIMMAYAIVRYRVIDAAVVLEKGLSYLTLFTVAAIPAVGMLSWAQVVYFGTINIQFTTLVAALFVIVAVGSLSLRHRTGQVVDQTLFKGRHQTVETLSTCSKALVTILEFRTLTQTIVDTLVQVMALRSASLFILDQETTLFVQSASAGNLEQAHAPSSFRTSEPLPVHLTKQRNPLVREELEYLNQAGELCEVIEAMRTWEAEICVPFMNKGRLLGFCLLGTRSSFGTYSNDNLKLLMTLAQDAAVAVHNALLYEELKRSQARLQRTDRFRSLEIIAGGFAHEVRNPLTSIKTFVQLAPHRSGDQEFLRHFGNIVFEDVERIEQLTQEILDYARQTNPQCTEENLNEIVEACLYLLEVKATGQSVIVEKQFESALPAVKVDRQQIKQAFLNLFLNALESMNAEGGSLRVKTRLLTKAGGDDRVQVEIADTGCGIPSDDLEHIFDPFFTTKHASREREGTGLGLTIAHQIIQEHGGTIEVRSIQKKGTTFLITLPSSVPSTA